MDRLLRNGRCIAQAWTDRVDEDDPDLEVESDVPAFSWPAYIGSWITQWY
jgi:hypothetical protein